VPLDEAEVRRALAMAATFSVNQSQQSTPAGSTNETLNTADNRETSDSNEEINADTSTELETDINEKVVLRADTRHEDPVAKPRKRKTLLPEKSTEESGKSASSEEKNTKVSEMSAGGSGNISEEEIDHSMRDVVVEDNPEEALPALNPGLSEKSTRKSFLDELSSVLKHPQGEEVIEKSLPSKSSEITNSPHESPKAKGVVINRSQSNLQKKTSIPVQRKHISANTDEILSAGIFLPEDVVEVKSSPSKISDTKSSNESLNVKPCGKVKSSPSKSSETKSSSESLDAKSGAVDPSQSVVTKKKTLPLLPMQISQTSELIPHEIGGQDPRANNKGSWLFFA